MATKTRKLTATTPVGTFTRRTARTYSHVLVECVSVADQEWRRLHDLDRYRSWLRNCSKDNGNYGYCQRTLAEALAVKPFTEDRYRAVSWVGRPDLLAARLKDTTNGTAYPVDAE